MASDVSMPDAGGERRGEILAFPRLGTLVCLVFHTKGTVVQGYCSGTRGYRCRRRRRPTPTTSRTRAPPKPDPPFRGAPGPPAWLAPTPYGSGTGQYPSGTVVVLAGTAAGGAARWG